MRPGVVMIPRPLPDGTPLMTRAAEIARRAEELGFHGVWVTDSMARGRPTLDPLALLAALAAATQRVELGTCVVQVPLRHPVEHAHRATTVQALSGGRLRFGVGAGSTQGDFDAVQQDFGARFRTLREHLAVMRRVWAEEAVYGPALPAWPGTAGGPPVLLGAWRSQRWIDFSVAHCQGWIASGIYAEPDELAVGARLYREAGGTRAVLANVFADFRPGAAAAIPHAKTTLVCSREEAKDRLARLGSLGFDDVLFVCPFDAPDQLEAIRSLM